MIRRGHDGNCEAVDLSWACVRHFEWDTREKKMGLSCTAMWKISFILLLLGVLSALCMLLPVEKMLNHFLLWVQHDVGPWGPIVLVLAYIPCTIFALPATILTLGGGYLFGLVIGFATDSVGSTAGAVAAFLVGRTVGKPYVTSKLKDYPQFQAISFAIEKSGFKICLLLRMVPLLPFNMLNYLLSVTPLSIWTYAFASWIGMMPMTLVFVYIGTTIKDITDLSHGGGHVSPQRWAMLTVGLAVSAVMVIMISRIAKDALQNFVREIEVKADELEAASESIPMAASESLPAPDNLMQLQEPLVLKIDCSGNHSQHQPSGYH